MKIWIKFLIGCTLGILLALFLPFEHIQLKAFFKFCAELTVRMGRYFLLPVLFFNMTIAVTKLRDTRKLLRTGLFTLITGAGITLITTLIGIVSALIIKLPRIPISVEKLSEPINLNLSEHFLSLFPYNGVGALFDGAFLLPVFVLAGFLGAGFASDSIRAKPAFTLFDSLSRISYAVLSFFTDLIAIGIIAVSCMWALTFFETLASGTFTGLFLLLIADTVIIIAGLLPVLLRFLCRENHPYKVLFAGIAPIIGALFSGDVNFSLALNLRHAKDSLGIRRRIGAVSMPIFSVFARGGTAMVIAVSFIVVLRSYSSLGIFFSDILWLTGLSFGISFCLGSFPTGGAFAALTILCTVYGRGFEAGYLLLKPAAAVICAFAAAIDTAISLFATYYVASREKMVIAKDLKHYI